jgi:hypothetical protein
MHMGEPKRGDLVFVLLVRAKLDHSKTRRLRRKVTLTFEGGKSDAVKITRGCPNRVNTGSS